MTAGDVSMASRSKEKVLYLFMYASLALPTPPTSGRVAASIEVEESKLPRPPPPGFVQIVPRGSSHAREPKRRMSSLLARRIVSLIVAVVRRGGESVWLRRGQQASPSCGANVFRRHHR